MAKSFLDSPNFPIILLGGAGVYLLSRTSFFKGIGQVGEGVGTAIGGAGTFTREVFVQGGETIRDVGQLVREITTGGGDVVRATTGGASDIIKEVGELGTGIVQAPQGAIGNIGGILTDTTGSLRNITGSAFNEILQWENRIFKLDDTLLKAAQDVLKGGSPGIVGAIYSAPSPANLILGGVTSAATHAAQFLSSGAITGGSVRLPTSSPTTSRGTAPMSYTVPMSVAPTSTSSGSPIRSVTSAISSAASSVVSGAKSLISSIGSKLRSIF